MKNNIYISRFDEKNEKRTFISANIRIIHYKSQSVTINDRFIDEHETNVFSVKICRCVTYQSA